MQVLGFQRLHLGVVHGRAAQVLVDLARQHHLCAFVELGGKPGLVEPCRAQRTGSVADDHLGHLHLSAADGPGVRALHRPQYGGLFAVGQAVNWLELAVIVVPARKVIQHVFQGIQAHLVERLRQLAADALHHRHRRVDARYIVGIACTAPGWGVSFSRFTLDRPVFFLFRAAVHHRPASFHRPAAFYRHAAFDGYVGFGLGFRAAGIQGAGILHGRDIGRFRHIGVRCRRRRLFTLLHGFYLGCRFYQSRRPHLLRLTFGRLELLQQPLQRFGALFRL